MQSTFGHTEHYFRSWWVQKMLSKLLLQQEFCKYNRQRKIRFKLRILIVRQFNSLLVQKIRFDVLIRTKNSFYIKTSNNVSVRNKIKSSLNQKFVKLYEAKIQTLILLTLMYKMWNSSCMVKSWLQKLFYELASSAQIH